MATCSNCIYFPMKVNGRGAPIQPPSPNKPIYLDRASWRAAEFKLWAVIFDLDIPNDHHPSLTRCLQYNLRQILLCKYVAEISFGFSQHSPFLREMFSHLSVFFCMGISGSNVAFSRNPKPKMLSSCTGSSNQPLPTPYEYTPGSSLDSSTSFFFAAAVFRVPYEAQQTR